MKKTKVIFFIYRLGGGGAARTLLNIVNYIDKDKFEPILVTLDFEYDYDQFVHPDVTFVKLKTKRLRSSIRELAKLLKKERPDILFSTVVTYNIVALLAKVISFTKVKVVVREAALLGGVSTKENIKLKIAGLLYRTAAKVISLSYGVKKNIVKRYHVPQDKIKVIYNPVDLQHIETEMNKSAEANVQKIIDSYDKVIVNAGRFVKEKDQHSLIRAYAKVHTTTKTCLLILGEGDLQASLEEEARKLGIQADVYFIGFQQNPYAIFKQADIFALTSTTEGFGHVLVEALATETLVVSTNCKPGAEEVLEKGKYGLLCEVGNVTDIAQKLQTALEMPASTIEKYHEAGMLRASQFAAEHIVTQYEAVFTDVVGRKENDNDRKSARSS